MWTASEANESWPQAALKKFTIKWAILGGEACKLRRFNGNVMSRGVPWVVCGAGYLL